MSSTSCFTTSVAFAVIVSILLVDAGALDGPPPPNEHINIWVVAHTHDDTGWLKTVDHYYIEEVQWILDTVTRALLENPERKFSYVEMAFFYRWWNELDDDMKGKVLMLIRNGQLQLNLAGWCMSDEGAANYAAVITQMTEGALFAMQQLNNRSTVGWHVDPFGHSAVTPSLWADIGFNAFSLSRIDYRDLDMRKKNKTLEFVWRGSKSLGKSRDMFTHILDSHYSTPGELGYDGGLFVQNDPNLPTFELNIVQQGQNVVGMARNRLAWYRHNHLLVPFGHDFAHQNALKSYIQMDKIIEYINSNATLNATIRYGTLDDYARAVNALDLTWDVYDGDFFPYATGAQSYWTGYYTSRPQFKGYVRSRMAVLHVAETLYCLGSQLFNFDRQSAFDSIDVLRKAHSVSQHHDALTGTEKKAVTDDYTLMLTRGSIKAESVTTDILGRFLAGGNSPVQLTLNSSVLDVAKAGQKISTVVYNSLGWERQTYVEIPVNRTDLVVVDGDGHSIPQDILAIPSSQSGHNDTRLYFLASVPPLGYNTYTIQVGGSGHVHQAEQIYYYERDNPPAIENDFYRLNFSADTGRLSNIVNKQSGKHLSMDQNLAQYLSAAQDGEQASGAYVFRPAQGNRTAIGSSSKAKTSSKDITFIKPVSLPAVVIATVHGSNYNDTFSVSVHSLENSKMSLSVFRVDQNFWSQGVSADFWAVNPHTLPSGALAGILQVGSSPHTKCKTSQLTFSKLFSRTPRLLATVLSTEKNAEAYVVSSFNVSANGAFFNVCRGDDSSWSQDVGVNWLAFEDSIAFSNEIIHGSYVVTGGSRNKTRQVAISLKMPFVQNNPCILASVSSSSRTFTVSSMQQNTWNPNEFYVTLANVDATGWQKDISIDWMVFSRWTYESPVTDKPLMLHAAVGKYVSVLRQDFRAGYAQVFRVFGGTGGGGSFPDLQYVEMEFQLGPIDKGGEVVSRFSTALDTNGVWYADDSGLEMQRRVYNVGQTERVSGNYYPMVAAAYLQDEKSLERMTVLSDRSHGCSSLMNGQLEVMLHRRCLKDDGYGVGETLDDSSQISPKLWMIYGDPDSSSYLQRRLSVMLQNPIVTAFEFPLTSTVDVAERMPSMSGLHQPLLPSLHLLSLRAVDPSKNDTILRMEHLFEIEENSKLSQPVNVSMSKLFATGLTASNPIEMSLTANIPKSVAQTEQLKWKTTDDAENNEIIWKKMSEFAGDGEMVTINPREIRTFIVNGRA